MNALDIAGGAAQGFNDFHEQQVKESAINRENAMKDLQIKEMTRKEALRNKYVPVSQFWPNYKDMPETMNAMKSSMQEAGFDVKSLNGDIPMIKLGDAEEMMKLMVTSADLQKKTYEATKTDLLTQHGKLSQLIDSGKDLEGKALKPEVIDQHKAELARIEKAYTGMTTLEENIALRKEAIKAQKGLAERKVIGKGPEGPISQDKAGRYYGPNNEPYTGDMRNVDLVGEVTRATPTTGSSSVVVTNTTPRDERSSDEKAYDRIKKEDPRKFKTFSEYLEWKAKLKPSAGAGNPFGGYGQLTGE